MWAFCLLAFFALTSFQICAQQPATFISKNIFQTEYFIENNGQFDCYNYGPDKIKYAVINAGDHIYFNKSGFVYRATKEIGDNNKPADPEDKSIQIIAGNISMHWINTNPDVQIVTESKSNHYFSFGDKQYNSFGYKKITYKNLYPGIDVVYTVSFSGGIKYSLILYPGANLNLVKYTYTGPGMSIQLTEKGLVLQNELIDLIELKPKTTDETGTEIPCNFDIENNIISFKGPSIISKTTTIDPWVGSLTSLTNGTNTTGRNKGFDVDYDYNGDLYVYGGGGYSSDQMIAKYSTSGVLLWTFSGIISSISWNASGGTSYAGNFIVDKTTGKAYAGQGFHPSGGSIIIRLDAGGNYDSFKTKGNDSFLEVWEMNFDCRSGNVIGMGGSTSSPENIGLIDKTTAAFSPHNFTGITTTYLQDILSSVFDPNGNLYVIIASNGTPKVNNHIFRVNPALNGPVWDTLWKPKTFQEASNKLYAVSSNGFNALGASNKYVFCYDGYHLMAYDVSTGNPTGNMDSIPNYTVKMQGGIVADECGHVFVGGDSGNIKVFKFDGTNYTALPDIVLAGSGGKHIYDLHYYSGTNTIFATGDSLAATVISPYACSDSTSKVALLNMCSYYVARITNPDSSSLYTFIWSDSATGKVVKQISVSKHFNDTLRNTGGTVYYLTLIRNALCGGSSQHFRFQGGTLNSSITDSFCPGKSYYFGNDTINVPGTYTNNYKSKGGCDSIATLYLGRWKIPYSQIDTTIALGDSFTFNNKSYYTKGIYTDTLLNIKGCDSLAILNLIVKGGDVYVPSAFSPNHDGHNDRLFPIPIRHAIVDKFCIYDRWGELIYESHGDGNVGNTHGWDGTYRGQAMPIATYVYFVTFRTIEGAVHTKKGDVTLVR